MAINAHPTKTDLFAEEHHHLIIINQGVQH